MNIKNQIIAAIFCIAILIPAVARAEEYKITSDVAYGCTNKDDFKKTQEFLMDGDKEAFQKLLGFGLSMGACVMFKMSEPVFLVDNGLFYIKVRRKGDAAEYWTYREAVFK